MLKLRLFLFVFALGITLPVFSYAQNDINTDINFRKISFNVGGQTEEIGSDTFSSWIEIRPSLYRDYQAKAEIENIEYCPTKKATCELLITLRNKTAIKKRSSLSVNADKIRSYLEDLGRRINKDPVDAKFQVEDGKVSVFTLSFEGVKLDAEKSLDLIGKNLVANDSFQETKKIDLPFEKIAPQINSDKLDNLGIDTLIGEGTSNFVGSPKNRIHNLTVGAQRFNGVLIKPNEEFSFIKTLGPVDESTGYLPELVIKQDKTEPDFGGGMCQVSTTAFRAAINSGLEITARTPHAYPVSYYNPQGMDATVFIPNPDLKFINNTPGHILIQTKIDGTKLIFDFYGTSDGRSVEVEGPKILERQPDGSMKTTFTQIVKDKDGNVLINDVFNSKYGSPYRYPHPGGPVLTDKPANWSKQEWKDYKKANGL
jgi:vancomycin resistance protein YoaR